MILAAPFRQVENPDPSGLNETITLAFLKHERIRERLLE
jgi:hypothetical protein